MDYLLETTTCSLIMEDAPQVKARLASLSTTDRHLTCPIVKGEIRYGIERLPTGKRRRELEQKATTLFSVLFIEPIPEEAGDYYAQMKRAAERQGTPLSDNDLWIVATTLALDAILVTSDSDFQRVQGLLGLRLEDWTN